MSLQTWHIYYLIEGCCEVCERSLVSKIQQATQLFCTKYSGLMETGTNLINPIAQLLYWAEWKTQGPHCEDAASGYLRWGFMQRSRLRGALCWIVYWGCSSVVTPLRVLLLVKWSQMVLMGHLIRRSRGRPRPCQGDYVIWFGNTSRFPRWSWKMSLLNSLIRLLVGWMVKNSPVVRITIFSSWIDILAPWGLRLTLNW